MPKLFVYGILIGRYPGAEEATLWKYEKFFRGHATIKQNNKYKVKGEIIFLTDEQLAEIDLIEGVEQGYYHRFNVADTGDLVSIDYSGEIITNCWIYQQVTDK